MLAALTGHKDLGIHSEMFAGGVIDLVNKGCITNNKKTLNAGKIISSFLIGPKKLYDFVNNNPFVGKLIKVEQCVGQNFRKVLIKLCIPNMYI